MVDNFDITKIEKPEYRSDWSDERFLDSVKEKRDGAYWLAKQGGIQKLNEYFDERSETSNYFSKSEKKYLMQTAKINFLPIALERLENIVKGVHGWGKGVLIDEIEDGISTHVGIQEILEFYKSNDKTPADRISAESLRMKERLLNITKIAHENSEKFKRNIDKEIEGIE